MYPAVIRRDNDMYSALDMYNDMKDMLDYFGLKWGEKDKLMVSFNEGSISYTYEGTVMTITRKG